MPLTRIQSLGITDGTIVNADINASAAIAGTKLSGAGKVLQVVNAKFGTLITSSSSTFADTGLTASITPSSASNKILVFANMAGCAKSANNTYMGLRLLRNSTTIHLLETQAGYTAGSVTANWGSDSVTYLDNPATTSATTYKVQFNNAPATGTVLINDGSSLDGCTITLMEIAA
jgi:hypothetical protein